MPSYLINEPKCVFIHIPKVAGTSIRDGFFKGNHSKPHFDKLPEEWQPYFKFAFVRNPYDRLISAWKMFTTGLENNVRDISTQCDATLSLKAFLDICMDESISHHDRSTLEGKLRHHAIPQTHPYNCLKYADMVGRFENLEEDFGKVCEKLEIPYSGLPHWNTTNRSDYKDYFDDESKALADEFLKEDIAQLGYTF